VPRVPSVPHAQGPGGALPRAEARVLIVPSYGGDTRIVKPLGGAVMTSMKSRSIMQGGGHLSVGRIQARSDRGPGSYGARPPPRTRPRRQRGSRGSRSSDPLRACHRVVRGRADATYRPSSPDRRAPCSGSRSRSPPAAAACGCAERGGSEPGGPSPGPGRWCAFRPLSVHDRWTPSYRGGGQGNRASSAGAALPLAL
jgi:hypothetical protein